MAHDQTRRSLLLRLRDPNDNDAWTEFDRSYRDLIIGYLGRHGTAPADAEEIYSNVLVDMNRRLARFEYRPERGRFRGYLRRVVDNALHTWFRGRSGAPARLDTSMQEAIAATDAAEQQAAWDEEWRKFHYRRAMTVLRRECEPKSLDVFQSLVEGESVADIAARMGMSEQAVHKVKQRSRDRLREIIRCQVAAEDGL